VSTLGGITLSSRHIDTHVGKDNSMRAKIVRMYVLVHDLLAVLWGQRYVG
jgi:hypothetical protein